MAEVMQGEGKIMGHLFDVRQLRVVECKVASVWVEMCSMLPAVSDRPDWEIGFYCILKDDSVT
jgi:hypothetical protein